MNLDNKLRRYNYMMQLPMNLPRRVQIILVLILFSAFSWAQQSHVIDSPQPGDWVCPMHPDVHSDKPGTCPRCGMTLIAQVPDRIEYPIEMSQSPSLLKPGDVSTLRFRVLDPETGEAVNHFELVYEKLMHIFLVSENLQFFAHAHPTPEADGSFQLPVQLPYSGMYRLLAYYYPVGSVPQLEAKTIFVSGRSQPSQIYPSLTPSKSENLTASLRLDPEQPLAGLETKLFFRVDPPDGLEPYLGAWAHMVTVSEDLIDLLHLHPFLADGGPLVQFNVIFPRLGLYRIWTQFQRKGVVNTVVFTVF